MGLWGRQSKLAPIGVVDGEAGKPEGPGCGKRGKGCDRNQIVEMNRMWKKKRGPEKKSDAHIVKKEIK